MKRTAILSIVLILLILAALFFISHSISSNNKETPADFYVGVTFCGNTTAEAKLLIDKVKGYTNLFVLQSWPISNNETATTEICDYAVAAGLNIIVNLGINWSYSRVWTWQFPWLEAAKQRYGDRFLGAYYDDEPAGNQLDYNWFNFFLNYSNYFKGRPHVSLLHEIFSDLEDKMANVTMHEPKDYDTEAAWFQMLFDHNDGLNSLKKAGIKTFTSDYVLYWFDYLGGYDVILAQFGWNNSCTQDIALVRGAAYMQNKSWGAIITWKYTEPPYLDSGEEIFKQMHMAYEAGAEYVVIFNYPQIEGNPYGALKNEHFEALEKLWKEITQKPREATARQADAALVLPRNYGWGMRHPEDWIWGFWGPDAKSPLIWENSRKLLSQYGTRLDIIYDDPAFPVEGKYPLIYYWNQTIQ
ncbi:MAG: hypothetical protein NWF09_09690 [Candidatus Bathyarchaeota archaeon]|nr:hypothetical protein [Candidatus Bathyarchaeota archaeon]